MAKEIVVTSVPRGIKLGRTGFQVVMRTAGVSDGVMSALEQLAGYRHVHPQGSGRNPVIYSYRVVRGPTGQLNVLGRTVDAGNDFSNRSNKLAHLLSVDPAEMAALRNSSPAAVLAAIEGRLATVWPGGPEERASPVALPAIPVSPAVCRRWEAATGDPGWGGVLAQRAMRGQSSLVIAPECSPAWSRTLLELFQEVYALLPPDSRWRTTFDTTVIGGSSSLLRATYAGSPEGAAGHAGLLVVDLSSRSPVPANMAADDFVSVARKGPKQSVTRGPSRAPGLPPALEGAAGPMVPGGQALVGQTTADPAGPPQHKPFSWDDDEKAPRSSLHWYILCGMLLAAIVLVAGSVAAWSWFDRVTTKGCQDKIYSYADADAGKPVDRETVPTLEDWSRGFRGDGIVPKEADFPLLLSALSTKRVDRKQVETEDDRSKLLEAVRGVLQGRNVLANAAKLGADVTRPADDKALAALESLVASWVTSRPEQPKVRDVGTLQQAIDAANQVVAAAFDQPGGKARLELSDDSVVFVWPDRIPEGKRPDVMKRFRKTLAANESGLSYQDASSILDKAVKASADADAAMVSNQKDTSGQKNGSSPEPTPEELARTAFDTLRTKLKAYKPRPPTDFAGEPVTLASGLDVENLLAIIGLDLPFCGKWAPRALEPQPDKKKGQYTWKLIGLPDDEDTHWGTVTLDTVTKQLTYTSTSGPDGPQDSLYIPLRFSAQISRKSESVVIDRLAEQQNVVAVPIKEKGHSLYDVLTGDPVIFATDPRVNVARSLIGPPNEFVLKLNRLGSKSPSGVALETRSSDGSTNSTTDVWLDITANDPKSDRRVWLESLSSDCELGGEEGGIRIQLSRKQGDSPPWTERATRFGDQTKPFPKLTVDWNRDKFAQLVKLILDDHHSDPATRKRNTVDALEKRIESCLGLDKKDDKMKLDEWRGRALDFVVKKMFVKKRGERPALLPLPKEIDPKAPPQEQDKYTAAKAAYLASKKIVDEWDRDLEEDLRSSWWRTEILFREGAQDPDTRDFAIVLLGIDAWIELAAEGKKEKVMEDLRGVSLDGVISATLDLQWRWSADGKPTPVRRFEITRLEPKQPGPTP